MGIYQLNAFLQNKCKDSIQKRSFKYLKGKKIVIDTSIYLYKYAKNNCIIEGMYKMISMLLYYEIVPIFIFDGKPPKEKYELLDARRNKKKEAENKYNSLKSMLEKSGKSESDIERNILLNNYKNIFVKIYKNDIHEVQEMMKLFGVEYYTAKNEADELCAYMVHTKKAWGCMTEDMDLFVYGCKYVLRYTSFVSNTTVIYDFNKIITDLHMSENDFREMCIMSGTDYNKGYGSIYKIYKLFESYKRTPNKDTYYNWVKKEIFKDKDEIAIETVKDMFDLSKNVETFAIKDQDKQEDSSKNYIGNGNVEKENLSQYLGKFNFIFLSKSLSQEQ